MVLMNSLSCSVSAGLARAMLTRVVRRKTASDVYVFIKRSTNWSLNPPPEREREGEGGREGGREGEREGGREGERE